MKNFITVSCIALLLLTACAGPLDSSDGGSLVGGAVVIQGAGATFPYPLYSRWFSSYNRDNPSIRIDYQSIGSGGGIKQISERTVDFGATDTPMSDDQLKALKRPILHIPTVLGAVVVAYHQPALQGELKLSAELLASIYLGEITTWNDARIAALNPGANLPDQQIAVIHRTDGSGTTAVFVDYLSKVSKTWSERVGRGTSVKFPVGIGGKGNEGVTNSIKQIEGSIGYVELIYAIQNRLAYAALQNQAGNFITPTLASVTEAAAGSADQLPDDMRMSITNAPGAGSYPIASYTYLLVYRDMENRVKAHTLARFLWWAIHEGQQQAQAMNYAPLPREVVSKAEQMIRSIATNGEAVLLPGSPQISSINSGRREISASIN